MSSPEGGVLGSEGEVAVVRGVEGVVLDGGETKGETRGGAGDAQGSDGTNEVSVRGLGSEAADGTAARTEGSGWFHDENNGAKQSSVAGERAETEVRSSAGVVMNGDGSGGLGTAEREEGKLSPTSEPEDRKKVEYNSVGEVEENCAAELLVQGEEDAEGIGAVEMEHDQDANDKGEVSAQKSSEDSDNPSEVADESSASEQSSDEQSEHDEEEDEQEEKLESEGEAEGMADADEGDEDGNSSLTNPESSYAHCKPLSVYPISDGTLGEAGRIFYGNDMLYILFRLYQILY